MDNSMEGMAHMSSEGQQDASQWQHMREESPFQSSYIDGDNEQLPYDVPLPMGLIQDHPEPLLIDRRLLSCPANQTSGKHSQASTATDNPFAATSRRGDGCDSNESLPLCNAEPMTPEEAEAFDEISMGSCFLEFGAFGMSGTTREEPGEASLRTTASQNAAEALQRFQAKGVLSRSSMDMGSRQMQASGSTDGDPSSNRSSFDTVPAAASSSLFQSTGWEEGGNAPRGQAAQQGAVGQLPPVEAQQAPRRRQQPAVSTPAAMQGGAPGNARAAHQALCLGVPDSRPRLALAQQETGLQQIESQQGLPEQARQQQQRRVITPMLQQSHMQLSLGLGLGLTLDLGSWHYGMTTGSGAAATKTVVTPRSTAAAHRRRAGAPVEEASPEQKPQGNMPTWPPGMGVAAVSLQNVCSNHLGTALTAADLLPRPPEAQGTQDAAHADFAKHLAGAVKQEALPGALRQFEHAVGSFSLITVAARASIRPGGQELSMRHESLERYRDKKRRRVFSSSKTIRYEKRKVNADRRPRVKGRFVKQMDVDTALEMIDEHSQVLPPPDCSMTHASDAECSGEDEDPSHLALHQEGDTCRVEANLP